jgi:hypothetical protein
LRETDLLPAATEARIDSLLQSESICSLIFSGIDSIDFATSWGWLRIGWLKLRPGDAAGLDDIPATFSEYEREMSSTIVSRSSKGLRDSDSSS